MTVHTVSQGFVNSFIVVGDGVTLVDAGNPGGESKILAALAGLGKGPRDVRRIIVTHHHADHAGALARVAEVTGAPVYMHRADAALVREGLAMRPGFGGGTLFSLLRPLARPFMPRRYRPAAVEHEVDEGDVIDDGFRVFHTPGHAAGHIALLREGFLFAGDAAANLRRPGPPFLWEDLELARDSFRRLAGLDFEAAGFGHGRTIEGGASAKFRG